VNWSQFERAAPELAARGRERIERFDFVLIGTLRSDGGPRVNPVEAYVVNGELTMNMMYRSRKALDLLGDPRVLVHSVVTRREGDEGEFKLRGRALPIEDAELREAVADNFEQKIEWRPPDESHFFAVDINSAVFVIYEEGHQHMTLWDPQRGITQSVRNGRNPSTT
jgi:Pyridoxamine 5'-phosphate oxidase